MGDEIELRGPFGGHFIWTVEDGGPVVLVGGGSGIVPLMSIVRHRLARLPGAPKHVYVCGSNSFAEAAAEHLMAAAVPREIIRIERYGG